MSDETQEIQEPRTLDKLLKLDTYQDMSDEEIEIVIEWRVKNAVQTADFIQTTNMQNAQMEILRERELAKAEQSMALLRELADVTNRDWGLIENGTS